MTVKAYIMISARTGKEDEVCNELVKFDQVEEVSTIYGEYDAIIKVGVEDMSHLDKFILQNLRGVSNISLTATMIIAKEYK
jgi:DNA-binding Lrp family transcriptional regulator